MSTISERVPRTALALVLMAILAALLAVGCGDDTSDQAQQQAEQAAAAQAQQQPEAQPIDAAQQEAQAQPPEQQVETAEQAQPAAQQQQSQPEPAEEQPAQQQAQTDQPVSDPDREVLIEGELFASSIGPDQTERTFRFQAATGAWLRIFVDGKGGMDPVVTLLQPDGTEIGVNDDLLATNRDSLLIAQVPTEGQQIIRVQPFDTNSLGDFVIQVQTLTIGGDDDSAVISLGFQRRWTPQPARRCGRVRVPGRGRPASLRSGRRRHRCRCLRSSLSARRKLVADRR